MNIPVLLIKGIWLASGLRTSESLPIRELSAMRLSVKGLIINYLKYLSIRGNEKSVLLTLRIIMTIGLTPSLLASIFDGNCLIQQQNGLK